MNDSNRDVYSERRQREPLLGAIDDNAAAFVTSNTPTGRAAQEGDATTSISGNENSSDDDSVAVPSLSLPLWSIYCLDGISLALPMTALLYIVNERVQIPVSLLSSYAALAFLPCSLKPLYAALSIFLSKRFGLPRHQQIAILLTLCATANAASICIARHAVVTCFCLAFVRCLLQSWPEFLYGLTLIDEAVACETMKGQRFRLRHSLETASRPRRVEDNNDGNNDNDNDSYAETAALFQSQSATARSMGCVTAHLLVLVFFVVLQWMRPGSTTTASTATTHVLLDYTTMAILMLATAAFNVIGAIVAWTCRIGESQSSSSRIPPSGCTTAPAQVAAASLPMTVTTRRQPSYDSLLDGSEGDNDPLGAMEMDTASQQGPVERAPAYRENGQAPRPIVAANHNPMTGRRNILLIVVLQLVAIVFSMRQPVIHASSPSCWNVLAIGSVLVSLGVGAGISGVVGWYKSSSAQPRDSNANADTTTHKLHGVGLFLSLRHAMPSVSYLMSSYYYTVFAKKMPSFLQVLSLWDMCVTTAACWTYGKCFTKYSRGRQLQCVMAGTTILAAVTSLGNVALLRVLDPESSRFSWTFKIALTLVMKTVLGFTSEWKFLPDIVLATTSVDAMATATTTVATTTPSAPLVATSCREDGSNVDTDGSTADPLSTPLLVGEDVVNDAELDNGQRHDCSRQSSTCNSNSNAIGLHYGTLVSCIDFGGQLGALSAGPLVALFGTTRDNDWAHLDWLQVANSILMVSSLVFLVLLNHRPR